MQKRSAITRMACASLLLCLTAAPARSRPAQDLAEPIYIGTQGSGPGQGVFAARFNPRDGSIVLTGVAAELIHPTWVLAHPRLPILYAVSDPQADSTSSPRIFAYSSDPRGNLRELGSVSSGGRGPTHLDFDAASNTLFVANYVSATAAALPVMPDGRLGEPASAQTGYGTGPNRRQSAPHAHAVSLDRSGRVLLVPDLGADRIFLHRFTPKVRTLTQGVQPFVQLPAGSGPRHIATHPGGRFVYLITELRPAIEVFRWAAGGDRLKPVETVRTMPDDAEDKNKGAEIAISPDGRFLYSSNRGEDIMLVHAIDRRSGHLREIQRIPSGGQLPWSFTIHRSGRWLLVANQGNGTVDVFRRDPRTGWLVATGSRIHVARPTSLAFLPRKRR